MRPEHIFIACEHPVIRGIRNDWAVEIREELDKHLHPGAAEIVDRLWKIDGSGRIDGATEAEDHDFKREWREDMAVDLAQGSAAQPDDGDDSYKGVAKQARTGHN